MTEEQKKFEFELELNQVLADIKMMLIKKNQAYGNSALAPLRIFSKSSPLMQLQVRIDDKLSRLKNIKANSEYISDEDTIMDLIGYLVLYKIAKEKLKE